MQLVCFKKGELLISLYWQNLDVKKTSC